jgi:hypothetical protein
MVRDKSQPHRTQKFSPPVSGAPQLGQGIDVDSVRLVLVKRGLRNTNRKIRGAITAMSKTRRSIMRVTAISKTDPIPQTHGFKPLDRANRAVQRTIIPWAKANKSCCSMTVRFTV